MPFFSCLNLPAAPRPPRSYARRLSLRRAAWLVLLAGLPPTGAQTRPPLLPPPDPAARRTAETILGRMAAHEHELVAALKPLTPRIETYLQEMRSDPTFGAVPRQDDYFLGRVRFGKNLSSSAFVSTPLPTWKKLLGPWSSRLAGPLVGVFAKDYNGDRFVQMLFPDRQQFDLQRYGFAFVRQEYLGAVRCFVFDVAPRRAGKTGRFFGRIWVEDQDDTLVRFNGVFTGTPHGQPFVHFDSWRVNVSPGWWVPAEIYSEESDLAFGTVKRARFQAQTRLWGYDLRYAGHQEELTAIQVEGAGVRDLPGTGHDLTPVESFRSWERQAEDNILDRLERSGLIAPVGEVDRVLETVVNNLILTNKLTIEPAVRCRVLLTTPIESAAVGHTIVLSRGLIDTLPDEASLAAMLAHELAHIALGQRLDTRYAFGDRMLFPDEESFEALNVQHTPLEEQQANRLAASLLAHSPYNDQMDRAGLFLRALATLTHEEPKLVSPHLGDAMFSGGDLSRLHPLAAKAPALLPAQLSQVAALPLGANVHLDPWTDQLTLDHTPRVPLLSVREKLPFEVTPFFPYLTRVAAAPSPALNPTATPGTNLGGGVPEAP